MGLRSDLVSRLIKESSKDYETKRVDNSNYGTIVMKDNEQYVQLDGSSLLTPVVSTVTVEDGDRVVVTIKDHSAIVTGSTSSPSASNKDVVEMGENITKFETVVTDKIVANKAEIDDLKAHDVVISTSSPSASNKDVVEMGENITKFETVVTDKIVANKAEIDDLKAHDVVIDGSLTANKAEIDKLKAHDVIIDGNLTANKAEIDKLKAHDVVIDGSLTANKAEIEELKTKKLDAEEANIKYAKIDFANIGQAVKAHDVVIDGSLTANKAEIEELKTKKLDAEEANIKYAKIDFANIGQAAIEKLFADSGIIKDLIVSGGHVTGELVGVTIKGDLIEGNTIVADKLVVKGSDGLYYKLNLDGEKIETEQTEYNSLNGSIITAKSITATKIAVDDLVAFNATIAGINMTDGTLYSGVKASADNTTKGFYLDREGQVSIGDGTNFLKYIKNKEGLWKLSISAGSIVLSSSGTDLDTSMGESIKTFTNEFYASKSPTELIGGQWTKTAPVWTEGIYIWERKLIEHNNGSLEYVPSENGICITGNTGAQGETGQNGKDAVTLHILSSNGNLFKNSMLSTTLTVTIIVGNEMITSSKQMHDRFGDSAFIEWEQKRFGEDVFTKIDPNDNRLSDEGFIMTLNPKDVYTQTTFNCDINY